MTAYGIAKVKLGNEETEMEETASNRQGNDRSSIRDIHCCSEESENHADLKTQNADNVTIYNVC